MPRFLLLQPHCEPSHARAERIGVPAAVSQAYSTAVTSLARTFRLSKNRAEIEGTLEARKIIAEYYNANSDRRAADLKDVSSFAARWHEQACRLAVNLHAAEHGSDAGKYQIQGDTAVAAVEIAQWFAEEQLAILRSGRSHSREQALTAIWRFAQTSVAGFTARQIQRKGIVEDSESATATLEAMVSKGVLTREEVRTPGHPKVTFKLNK